MSRFKYGLFVFSIIFFASSIVIFHNLNFSKVVFNFFGVSFIEDKHVLVQIDNFSTRLELLTCADWSRSGFVNQYHVVI